MSMTTCSLCKERFHVTEDHKCPVSPPHYQLGGFETADVIAAWDLNFFLGNVVKYVSRAGHKDPDKVLEDLRKARWYLDREIRELEGLPETPHEDDCPDPSDAHVTCPEPDSEAVRIDLRDLRKRMVAEALETIPGWEAVYPGGGVPARVARYVHVEFGFQISAHQVNEIVQVMLGRTIPISPADIWEPGHAQKPDQKRRCIHCDVSEADIDAAGEFCAGTFSSRKHTFPENQGSGRDTLSELSNTMQSEVARNLDKRTQMVSEVLEEIPDWKNMHPAQNLAGEVVKQMHSKFGYFLTTPEAHAAIQRVSELSSGNSPDCCDGYGHPYTECD